MHTRRLALQILSVVLLLCSRFALAQTEPTLLKTIRYTANELTSLPMDVILDNSSESYSDWDLRYDVTYSQFRLLYGLALTAELSSKEETLECLAEFDAMSPKEKGLALIALYVYHRNAWAPLNTSVIHNYYPDKDVSLGEPFDNTQLNQFIDLLKSYQESQEVCVQRDKEADVESWEEDFRKQARAFQTIAHYTDSVTGMYRGKPLLYADNGVASERVKNGGSAFELDDLSIRFLYTLTLLQTLNDEPVTVEPSIPHYFAIQPEDLTRISELSPRGLLSHNLELSRCDVLMNANQIESFYEVIFMREYLRTQFVHTRVKGSDSQTGLCGDSSPDNITLGSIASSVLNAINAGVAQSIANTETGVGSSQESTEKDVSNTKESFLEYLSHTASEMNYFDVRLALERPERISPPQRSDIYVLRGETKHELCLDLTSDIYQPFFEFCNRFEQTSCDELNEAFERLGDLSPRDKALLLTALTYRSLRHNSTDDSQIIDVVRLTKALEDTISQDDSNDVIFQLDSGDHNSNLKESWRNVWEKNWRYDVWRFQYVLGDQNPFLNMGCTDEEIIQFCTTISPKALYAVVSWEVYSDLQSPLLPPPCKNLTYRNTNELTELLASFGQKVQLDSNHINAFDLTNQSPINRRLRIDGMREYLLMQYGYTRTRRIYLPQGAGRHLGTFAMSKPLTLKDVATCLLEALDGKQL